MKTFAFILTLLLLNASHALTTNSTYKIPIGVFFVESLIPGGGHVYNNHLDKAIYSFTTSFIFLGLYSENKSNYSQIKDDDTSGDQKNSYYKSNRKTRYKALSGTYLTLFLMTYFDSIIEAYQNLNKNQKSDFEIDFGIGISESTLSTRDESSQSVPGEIKKEERAPRPILNINHGALIGKKLFLSPDLLDVQMNVGVTFFNRAKILLFNRYYTISNPADDQIFMDTHYLGAGLLVEIIQNLKMMISTSVLTFFTSWESEKIDNVDKIHHVEYGKTSFISGNVSYRLKNNLLLNFKVELFDTEEATSPSRRGANLIHRYYLGSLSYLF